MDLTALKWAPLFQSPIQYVPRIVFSTTKVHDICSIGANVSQEKGLRLMHQASLGINV